MTFKGETTADHIKRVFKLYWTISSAGGLGLLFAVFLAPPEMQKKVGPYAWLALLAIFMVCLTWVFTLEYRRYRQRLRYTMKVAVAATFNIKIINKNGDAELNGYREVINNGKVPIKNLPEISFGYLPEASAPDQPIDLNLTIRPPQGKTIELLNHYCYKENGYVMNVWNYYIPEGLNSAEKIEYSYSLPVVPNSEADAFKTAGGMIVANLRHETHERVNCNVTAPSGYKFVVLGTSVKDEFQKVNESETKRVQKLHSPQVPREKLGNTLKWEILEPFPRHDYECKYRLEAVPTP